ncbi:YjiH family protein [Salibacterium qingdaonense]|uniref:Nucleoside recognition GATE domain-containing membrane protein YjiH n=1 Tax=Salibacterium qingdaonense TaxID=266892 RepID=A0A1I4K1G6_9BACI|nr:YjiH family protein [Salibacterium qingdaonense]SFL72598.1 nucleoside recognition GATE domain-containing membrane protein YjiH [Salibacterium qingdaonense]
MNNNTHTTKETSSLRFLLFSAVGIFLFMIPMRIDGEITIAVAFLADLLGTWAGPVLPAAASLFMGIAVVGSLIAAVRPPDRDFMKSLFAVDRTWLFIRILGFILSVLVVLDLGPEWLISGATGGLMLEDLIPLLITVFLFAGLFLPFLLQFGLLEFCGAVLSPIMRPLFTLPGRSSIDCAASWLGDGTIGVLLTNKQYEQGHYSKREAAVIGTTFSVVSITFSIVILSDMNLTSHIIPYYATIVAAGFVAALIMPRIPPLSRKKDLYTDGRSVSQEQTRPESMNVFQYGFMEASRKAARNKASSILSGGVKNVLDMWIGVLPVVMALGTIAVVIAENTPFFAIIGAPFVPLLDLLQVPEAAKASETMLVGFADMLLPSILGAGIESELTRFVIAALSVTQLIYMSEVGGLLLASKLPISFTDLVLIFLERTIITLPIIIGCAHLIF